MLRNCLFDLKIFSWTCGRNVKRNTAVSPHKWSAATGWKDLTPICNKKLQVSGPARPLSTLQATLSGPEIVSVVARNSHLAQICKLYDPKPLVASRRSRRPVRTCRDVPFLLAMDAQDEEVRPISWKNGLEKGDFAGFRTRRDASRTWQSFRDAKAFRINGKERGEKQVINPFAEYQWISQPYPEYNMPKVAHDVKPHRRRCFA